jgi:hypothetical protein
VIQNTRVAMELVQRRVKNQADVFTSKEGYLELHLASGRAVNEDEVDVRRNHYLENLSCRLRMNLLDYSKPGIEGTTEDECGFIRSFRSVEYFA